MVDLLVLALLALLSRVENCVRRKGKGYEQVLDGPIAVPSTKRVVLFP